MRSRSLLNQCGKADCGEAATSWRTADTLRHTAMQFTVWSPELSPLSCSASRQLEKLISGDPGTGESPADALAGFMT